MHGQEGNIEPDEHEPEGPSAEPLRQLAFRKDWHPVIETCKERKHHPANQDIMHVGHDEIRVMGLPIERDHGPC